LKKITFFVLFIFSIFQMSFANGNSKIFFLENEKITSICLDCDNATDGGEIAGDETECPNPIFDPSLITNVTLPSGGTGNLEYIWIFSTDADPFGANAQWTPIIGSNAPEYDPDPINMTTHYRRCARREGCVEYVVESNIITKEIACCDPLTDGGEIGSDQEGCAPSFDPNGILNITLPSGGSGNLEYQWWGSIVGSPFDPNSADWFLIPGANGPNFDPGLLLQTTWFVRTARRENCQDFDGISNIVQITILEAPLLESEISSEVLCFGDSTAAIDLMISNGLAPYQINWDNGIGSVDDPQNLPAGVYNLTVTDANFCSSTLSVTITEPDPLAIQLNATTVSCGGSGDGTASVGITGGTPDYIVEWNNGETSDTIQNLSPANYIVTVTDENGCVAIDSIEVSQSSDMILSSSSTNATCQGFSDGTATVTVVSGGTPDFTYLWSDDNAQTSQTATNLPSGEYFVTVTDANGCEAVDTINIEDGISLEVFTSIDSITCFGGDNGVITIDSIQGGTPDYSVVWSMPGNNGSMTLSNLSSGNYIYIITDQNGCSVIDSVQLSDGYEIIVEVSTEDPSCLGVSNGSAQITQVLGGVPDYTFNWSPMGQNTNTINGLPPGNYSVVVTDQNGCTGEGMGVINTGTNLIVETNSTDETCLDFGDGFAEVVNVPNANGPLNFIWSNGETTASIDSLFGGFYEVIVTDSLGCVGTDSVTIESGGVMSVGISKMDVNCGNDSDGTATVNISGGTPDYQFQWNDPNAQTTQTAINLSPGNYEVIVTDAVGCTATDNVEIESLNSVEISLTSEDVTCFGDSNGFVSVSVLNGNIQDYSINWNTTNNQNEDLVENLPAGIYAVTVTDSTNCSTTDSIQINEPNPLSLIVTGNGPSCFDANDGSANAQVSGGNGGYSFFWITTETTPTITGLANGVYFVTVTDAKGCAEMDAVQLLGPPEITIDFTVTDETCDGTGNGSILAEATGGNGGFEYNWTNPSLVDSSFVEGLTSGDYVLQVTDMNGCTGEATASVSSESNLNLEIVATDITCYGKQDGTATAVVTGGSGNYTYSWNIPGGSTNQTIINLSAGTYTVEVLDSDGCAVTGSAIIEEPAILDVTIVSSNVVCSNDLDGSATATATGGTPPYAYIWSNGETTETISNVGAGTYSLTVTDANNCQATSSTIIDFTSDLSGSSSSQPTSCFGGNDGEATASGLNGQTPYTYAWSNGQNGTTISNLIAGTYEVTITDNNGCEHIETVVVVDADAITCSASILSPISTFNGDDGEVSVSATGGTGNFTYDWQSGETTSVITNLSAGSYSVTVTDENGCTCESSITLENPSQIGNFVWKDLNENGIQDIGEPGLDNVEVTLTGTTISGNPVNRTTFTNADGEYLFDGLESGTYQLKFELLTNYVFSPKDEGSDNALDSDVDINGETISFAIATGSVNLDWDAGMIELDEKINLGNFVWEDINRNGIQDTTETGVVGVTVRLIDVNSNFIIASTVTNIFGFYQFNDVMPGEYQIEFVPSSLPTGFTFIDPDQTSDESKDSDPNPADGKTPVFEVFPFTLDDFTWDAGIYEACDNVTSGGIITGDEELCGIGADPSIIENVTLPAGGFGALEYLWLQSNVPIYNGPGDPNWTIIPNSNSPSYDPGPISSDTYYIRCARREGCTDYIGETNIISKTIIEYPLTNIEEFPTTLCVDEGGKFVASIAGGGAMYFWEFGNQATPSTANTRTVNDVSWSTAGFKPVILTVTRFGCSFSTSVLIEVESCPTGNPLIVFGDLEAELINNGVLLTWNSNNSDKTASYSIERAEMDNEFKSIGAVKGTDELENDYEFIDETPLLGESQYRLKRIDSEYEMMYSEVVTIFNKPQGVADLHFYPNPFSNSAILDVIEIQEAPVYIEVINTFAQVMETIEIEAGETKREVDFSHLPSGMYYINVTQKGKRDYTFRVFKADN
jgi:hypothetical protein